jgi:trimeric autotransporter adhesin
MKHVTFHLPSFLRRVRIHGGEFDSSARAMNRVSGKGSLMSYESAASVQADPRIVRGSTIERKQMSTTIKRISLVAVAALGLSLVSVVPSSAAINQDTLTLSAATAAQTTAETLTATSAVATLSFLGAQGDSASVSAALVSGPAGNTALPYLRLTETASATIDALSPAVGTRIAPNTAVVVAAGANSAVTTAKFAVYLSTNGTAAPTVAGAYVVRITPASVGGSGALLGAKAVDVAITVTTAPALDKTVDVAKSTSILNTGETVSATADATVSGSMTIAAGVSIGTIAVTLKNAADAAVTSESYTASILSGPGLLGAGTQTNATAHGATAVGRALTVKNGDSVGVFADGASGVSKIEIRTAAGVLIATETVTFHGAIASIVATVAKATIGTTAADAVTAVAKDKDGTIVQSGTLYALSGTTTVIASGGSATITAGKATFSLTGLTAGTSAITVADAATAATATVSAAPVSVRVGSSTPASITVAMDKTSYAPGEAITATITVLDATGLVVADGVYNNIFAATGISANYTIAGWSDTTTVTVASGVGTRTGFLPSTEGDVTFKWTTGTNLATANQAVAGTATVAVSSPAAAAATDAANEATDAANAATDAALAAAEAADAATSAAQEASDAVAALSESVTKLIAGLQSQIKSLAAVVAKIARKVKA